MKLGALLVLSAAAAVFVPVGVLTDSRPTTEWSVAVTPLASPAGVNSAQPQLSVQGDHVVLSWVERRGETATLRFSERTDEGWTQARTAASGTNWFVGLMYPRLYGYVANRWRHIGCRKARAAPTRMTCAWRFQKTRAKPGRGR